jgi:hypothetical protein
MVCSGDFDWFACIQDGNTALHVAMHVVAQPSRVRHQLYDIEVKDSRMACVL